MDWSPSPRLPDHLEHKPPMPSPAVRRRPHRRAGLSAGKPRKTLEMYQVWGGLTVESSALRQGAMVPVAGCSFGFRHAPSLAFLWAVSVCDDFLVHVEEYMREEESSISQDPKGPIPLISKSRPRKSPHFGGSKGPFPSQKQTGKGGGLRRPPCSAPCWK